MEVPTLRDHPHLPLLNIDQCLAVFQHAGLTFNRMAQVIGYGRQSIYLWRNGRAPSSHALDRVSTLAYRALAGLKNKKLPMPARAQLDLVQATLNEVNLADVTAEQLLPKNWLKTINTQ